MHPLSRSLVAGLVLIGTAAGIAPLNAQIQQGRIYSGGEEISDPSVGLTLTLPAGWRGSLAADGVTFVLESDAGGGYMVLLGDESTEAQARAQLAGPLDLGDGVVLTPSGEIGQLATGHLTATYDVGGALTEYEGFVDVRLTESGLGLAFILLTPPDVADEHLESMRAFAFSLGVTEPTAQPAGSDEWEPFLRGVYLVKYFTATGYTESRELWLCTDGSFWFNGQAGGFGGGASGAAQTLGGGRWSATGAGATGTLLLEWSDGDRSSWPLEYDYEQNRVYVNGERMLRGDNERCN